MTNSKHYKGKQNIGEVQTSQECGSWKPADWLGFFFWGRLSKAVYANTLFNIIGL